MPSHAEIEERRKLNIPSYIVSVTSIEPRKGMRYNLEVLSNGFIVCNVTVIMGEEQKICKALIDTGSNMTLIDKSFFNTFTSIDESKFFSDKIKTIDEDIYEIPERRGSLLLRD